MWRSVSHLRAVRTTRNLEDVMTSTAAPLAAPRRHRSPLSIGIAVVALAGVPAIWLPFAYGISPASALFDDGFSGLWPLAWTRS